MCQACSSIQCLHFQAYERCHYRYNDCFRIIQASSLSGIQYFSLNTKIIILKDMNDIHVLRLNEEKWFCDSCNKLCKLKKIIETLLIPLKSEISRKSEQKIIYESVSNNPIPFSFNQNQSLIYQKQIFERLNLPQDLCPDIGNCKNGYKYP